MPPKSIAVPLNPSARRGARLLAATNLAQALFVDDADPPQVAPPPETKPALHRYKAGERLRMGNGGNIVSRVAAHCTVVSLLPYEGRGAPQYRVRSEAEAFERIVAEGDLSRG